MSKYHKGVDIISIEMIFFSLGRSRAYEKKISIEVHDLFGVIEKQSIIKSSRANARVTLLVILLKQQATNGLDYSRIVQQ
jgi:hypothetical protein